MLVPSPARILVLSFIAVSSLRESEVQRYPFGSICGPLPARIRVLNFIECHLRRSAVAVRADARAFSGANPGLELHPSLLVSLRRLPFWIHPGAGARANVGLEFHARKSNRRDTRQRAKQPTVEWALPTVKSPPLPAGARRPERAWRREHARRGKRGVTPLFSAATCRVSGGAPGGGRPQHPEPTPPSR